MEKTIKDLDIYISDGNYSSKYPRSEEFVKEGIPFIRGNNMVDGDISDDEMYYITPEKHAILLKGHVKAGDVLITTRGNIGQVAIVPERHEDSNINAQIVLLRTNSKSLYNRYLLWALQSHRANEQYIALQTGTALKQLPVGKLEKLSIKVADIDEQHDIANTLDKVYEVIKERRKELLLLDNLIKARFVEMFGDMKPTVTIERYIAELRGGKSLAGTEECKNKVLKTGAATFGWFDPEQYKYLPVDYEPLPEHKVETGDVIISRMNTPELVGACSYVFEAPEDMYYPDRLWKVIPQPETNPIFLWQLLWDREIRRQIKEKSGGTSGTMHNISKSKLLEIKCIDAPIELQNQFAGFVHQVDKSKVAVQKALTETQLLFDSLMQQYFG